VIHPSHDGVSGVPPLSTNAFPEAAHRVCRLAKLSQARLSGIFISQELGVIPAHCDG
jgi:hypothetical protein